MLKRVAVGAAVMFAFAAYPALAANPAHEALLAMSANDQAYFIGSAAGCSGTTVFLMGLGTEPSVRDYAFWSVRCSDGRELVVLIMPDQSGSTQVLDCEVLEAVAGVRCFERF